MTCGCRIAPPIHVHDGHTVMSMKYCAIADIAGNAHVELSVASPSLVLRKQGGSSRVDVLDSLAPLPLPSVVVVFRGSRSGYQSR